MLFLVFLVKMYRRKYLTQAEIEELMNASSDEEEAATEIKNADHVDFIVLPPERVDAISDAEDIDDNDQILNDVGTFVPNDIVGEIEVNCEFEDDNVHRPESPVYEDIEYLTLEDEEGEKEEEEGARSADVPSAEEAAAVEEEEAAAITVREEPFVVKKPKWTSRKNYEFSKQPVDLSEQKSNELYEKLGISFVHSF